jgi:hypothetical protein
MALPMLPLFCRRSKREREIQARIVLTIAALAAALYVFEVLSDVLLNLWNWAFSGLVPGERAGVQIALFLALIAISTAAMMIWGKLRHRRPPN